MKGCFEPVVHRVGNAAPGDVVAEGGGEERKEVDDEADGVKERVPRAGAFEERGMFG